MHPNHPPRWLRWGATVVFPLLLAGLLAAQKPKKPIDEEEAPKNQPPTKKKVIDEDEAPKAAPKKKKVVEDDDMPKEPPKVAPKKPVEDDGAKPKAVKSIGEDSVDLVAEAAKAKHARVQALFRGLAYPHDILKLRSGSEVNVVPVDVHVGDRANDTNVQYTPLLSPNQPDKLKTTAAPGQLIAARHFEDLAIERVNAFLEDGLLWAKNPGDPNYVSRLDQLIAADKVLTFAAAFHEAARANKQRKGAGWDAVRDRLRGRLREALSDELAELDRESAANPQLKVRAADIAFRLGENFSDSIHARRDVTVWKLNQAGGDLAKDDVYVAGAKTLSDLEKQFPTADKRVLEPLRDKLKRRAQAHLAEAKKLAGSDEGKYLAQIQLDLAKAIYADVDGLRDFETQLARTYRMIVVGVKELPERMSPALAVTDADRWACELLYEGLIQAVPDPEVGQRYRPQLAAVPPKSVPLAREFRLVPDAVWATKDGAGEKITAEAVRKTIEMMQELRLEPAGGLTDVLQKPSITDPQKFQIGLDRGCLEPLAAMTFKVMPAHILEKKPLKLLDPEFAANPVGSGPFVYHGRRTENGREFAIFKANPAYGKRQGKFGLPRLQEIRFTAVPGDAAADLRAGKIDLLLDVPTAELVRLRSPDLGLSRLVTERTLPTRRIWMLAVNHRKPELGHESGRAVRRALAHALDREAIVKSFKVGTTYHRALNGPFPPDTWAIPTDEGATATLFRADHAKTFAGQGRMPEKLTLKFAADPLAQQACTQIKAQIEALNLGVRIDLAPLPAAALHQAVMVDHDYDLAYVPFDFDETYSLTGLLDPDAVLDRGGRNFLGYRPEANLTQMLTRIRATRNFELVKRESRLLYKAFTDQMPFVPLWQLDFHLVATNNLKTVPLTSQLDPLTVFDQAEEWRIDR